MPTKQAKKPQTTEEKTQSADPTLDMVVKDFESSWKYTQGSWHKRWQDNYKLYHNERVKVGYRGITNTFVPMVFGTVETLCSALFGSKPKFQYLPPKEVQDQKTDILNSLIDFYWDKDQWSVKVINTGRDMLRLGTAIDYFCWAGDHPMMINVPIRDFFIDPTATTLENARFMGRRYLTTIEELKTFEIIDLDNPIETPILDELGQPTGEVETTYNMKPKYKIPADWETKVGSAGDNKHGSVATDEKTDKQEKDDLYGSTLEGEDTGQVEVLEYWTNDKTISVMNRKITIEDSENYYKAKDKANGAEYPEGLMPFAAARDYVDTSLFYAKGEVDFIADEQELLNDITNQNIDAITYVLNPMYTLDPKYGDAIETVENLPGAVYPFEAGALNRIEMGGLPPDAFAERQNIKNEIRETTASNEIVKGAPAQGGKSTATEINAQIAGAGQRIGLKITQLENEYFHRVARIVFRMIQLYVTEPMMVRILGKDGAKWEQFDPSEFEGDYEPRVQLDIAIENKKMEQAAMAKEMLGAFLNDPDVNQQELKKLVMSRAFDLEPDEVEQLIQPMPVDPMTGQPIDPMAAMMGGAIPSGAVPTPSPDGMMPPMEDIALMEQMAAEQEPEFDTDVVEDPETGEVIDLRSMA